MPSPNRSEDFEDRGDRPVRKADSSALRIIARWVAEHDRAPVVGAIVDRDFVLLDPFAPPRHLC